MSRIGKKPVSIPPNVKVRVQGRDIQVEGPKGKLSLTHHPNVRVIAAVAGGVNQVVVERVNDEKISRSVHGLTRALIANMIQGVAEGFSRDLEIQGVGYKAEMRDHAVFLSVGFANQIKLPVPDGVAVKIDGQGTRINISGMDKQAVGQLAADIRRTRKPEPYQGKGIRYANEVVRRKAGKQFAGAGAK